MLQFTTVVASGWPFLQWPTPSTAVLTVVNVAGGPPPAFADAAGSIASAKSNVVMKTPGFFIPTAPKPPALARRRLRNAAAEVRPFLAGEPYGAVSDQGITRTLYASRRGMRLLADSCDDKRCQPRRKSKCSVRECHRSIGVLNVMDS